MKALAFEVEALPADAALDRISEPGEPDKMETVQELFNKNGLETLTFFRSGPSLDVCDESASSNQLCFAAHERTGQVRVLCAPDRFHDCGKEIIHEHRGRFVRAERDNSGERLGTMFRSRMPQQLPTILVVGENEAEAPPVTMRSTGSRALRAMPVAGFKDRPLRTIATHSMTSGPI